MVEVESSTARIVPFLGGSMVFSIIMAGVYIREFGWNNLTAIFGMIGLANLLILGLVISAIPYVGLPFYTAYVFLLALPAASSWQVQGTNILAGMSQAVEIAVVIGLAAGAVMYISATESFIVKRRGLPPLVPVGVTG